MTPHEVRRTVEKADEFTPALHKARRMTQVPDMALALLASARVLNTTPGATR